MAAATLRALKRYRLEFHSLCQQIEVIDKIIDSFMHPRYSLSLYGIYVRYASFLFIFMTSVRNKTTGEDTYAECPNSTRRKCCIRIAHLF